MIAKKKATRKRGARKKIQGGSDQRKYTRYANLVLCRYLIDQCWMSGRNQVYISDEVLRKYYKVHALRQVRIDWLGEDAKPWFTICPNKFTQDYVQKYDIDFTRIGFNRSDEFDEDNRIELLPSIEHIEL